MHHPVAVGTRDDRFVWLVAVNGACIRRICVGHLIDGHRSVLHLLRWLLRRWRGRGR